MQGVVGGVAYVTKPRQLSYLSLPSQTLLHGKLLHREMNVKDWIWKKVSFKCTNCIKCLKIRIYQ